MVQSWFGFGLKIFDENGQNWPFLFLLDTPTPRCGAHPRRRSLCLGEPEPRVSALSSPPKRSSALPRRTSPPRHNIGSPKSTCKYYFGSSLLLILIIIHCINEDPVNERVHTSIKII